MEKKFGYSDGEFVSNALTHVRLERNMTRGAWFERLRQNYGLNSTGKQIMLLSTQLYPPLNIDTAPVNVIMDLENARNAFIHSALIAQKLLDELITNEQRQLVDITLGKIIIESHELAVRFNGPLKAAQEHAMFKNIKGYAALALTRPGMQQYRALFHDTDTQNLFHPAYIEDAEDGFGLILAAAVSIIDPDTP